MLSTGKPQWVGITDVTYSRHEKHGGLVSLKVTYRCGLAFHTEWVCFEHEGYQRRKAASWWRERAPELEVPESVDEALLLADRLGIDVDHAVKAKIRSNARKYPVSKAKGRARKYTELDER